MSGLSKRILKLTEQHIKRFGLNLKTLKSTFSIFAKNTNSLRSVNPIGTPFFELSEVDSSNNYAMRQAREHLAVHGATWFAHHQLLGKGQRGKGWNAEPGQNIMMSSILNPPNLFIDNQFIITVVVALACYDFFKHYAKDKTSIKWPNDIYWDDRKAGGILIENLLKGKKWKFAIVGIGININQTFFPSSLPNPVSLKQITGKNFNVLHLAKHLCTFMELRWQQLLKGKELEQLEEYNSHLYKLEEKMIFKTGNGVFSAIVKGVNSNGELIIDTGQISTLAHGSADWVLST